MSKKYKLILVDDEYLVRKGLRYTVDWDLLDVEIVGEYENGKQALAAVERDKPDLIISDVRMPVMDGLELAAKLAEQNYDGAIIFYSGYSDFEYVRQALVYGVSGYVLKPVEKVQLTEQIADTIVRLEEQRKKRAAADSFVSGAAYIKEMCFDKLAEGVDDKSLGNQLAALGIVFPDEGIAVYGKPCGVDDDGFKRLYDKLTAAVKDFGVNGFLWSDKFVLVTALTDEDALCACAERLLGEIYKGIPATPVVGVSDVYDNQTVTVVDAVVQAKKSASRVLPVGGVYRGEDIYKSGDKSKRIVDEALALIYEHYPEKITIKWVADKLFVSESHLMHEFKVETGTTFKDCLKQYRIAKAKELFQKGNMRISEVAEAVGIPVVRYFGQVFKEQVGKTPTEYVEFLHENN